MKLKKVISFIMTLALLVTIFPPLSKQVYAETASLTNLGNLGTVKIGNKTESGKWFKTYVDGNPVFCLNLGKACHSEDVFEKTSSSSISSDSKNVSTALKARVGHWYDIKEKNSNKAWIVAQCLIWGIEEGITSKAGLTDIISQIKDSAGYRSKTAEEIYDDILGGTAKVQCTIIQWKSTAESRQVLMEIVSSNTETEPVKYHKLSENNWYRQRITLYKENEDGIAQRYAKFKVKVDNYKELYSYAVDGEGCVSGDADSDGFEVFGEADVNGMIAFRFTYRLQSKDYYYYDEQDLKGLTKAEKKKLKDKLDKKGYEYADNLTKEGAEDLAYGDIDKQRTSISNAYYIDEVSSGDVNITTDAEYEVYVNDGNYADKGNITKTGKSSAVISIYGVYSWWRNEDGTWDDTLNGREEYPLAMKVKVRDRYKKAKVTFQKKDADTKKSAPQGDATLDGAVYEVYGINNAMICDGNGNKNQRVQYTVKDGCFQTDYLQCGKEYYVREMKPSQGYMLDEELHKIKVNGSEFSEELNIEKTPIGEASYEQVIKAPIEIVKMISDGKSGITPPEVNAEFQVYLASAGSYEKAKETERDYLVTDKNGYARTKNLPYGTYIVHQVKGDIRAEKIQDFSVEILENGEKHSYILNNPLLEVFLKIVKKDKRTKKVVLKPNTTYQIYALDDKDNETIVEQNYNDGHGLRKTDRFTTDGSGMILTYEYLTIGRYRIKEIESAEGTYNSGQFLDIEITEGSYKTEIDEQGSTYNVAEVEFYNDETFGQLTVEKTGEVLKDLINVSTGDVIKRKFIYEDTYLRNTEFEIYAKENIVTQDNQGTTWFDRGEKVATLIIGKGAEFTKECNGICTYKVNELTGAVTVTLPLGKYTVKESKTNYGYILGEKSEWDVEFKWKCQEDRYVLDSTGAVDEEGVLKVKNERANPDIRLIKKDYKVDMGIKDAVFGLYTADDIYASDGRVLAKAGELITTVITDKDGYGKVDADLPLMSEQYSKDQIGLNSGDYYFVEQKVSDSYYLDETKIPIHLVYKDAKTSFIQVEAKHINVQTQTEINKVSLVTGMEIEGSSLIVTDEMGNIVVSWTSKDKDSIKITEQADELGYANLRANLNERGNLIIDGLFHDKEYQLTETRPADGYVTAESICFKMVERRSDDGVVSTDIYIKDETGEFVRAENNKVIMKDDVTKVEFRKIASDTKKLLGGAEYKVYDSKNEKVCSFTTSNKNVIKFEGKLKVGETYTFVESKAPEGYKKANDAKITIEDNGKVQKIKVIDQKAKRKELKEKKMPKITGTPQTGIKTNMLARMIMLIVLAVVVFGSCFNGRKSIKIKKNYR